MNDIHIGKNHIEVRIKLDKSLLPFIKTAADWFYRGSIKDLAANCFLDRFEALSKEIADAMSKDLPPADALKN